ncbi:MAG TPA: ATP-binding protein [Methyloradius sp.]
MGRLFWKIFIGLSLTFLIVSAVIGGMVYLHEHSAKTDEGFMHDKRADFLVGITANALEYGGEEGAKALFKQWPERRGATVLIVDADGNDLIGRAVPQGSLAEAVDALVEGDQQASVRKVRTHAGNEYILFSPMTADTPPHLRRSPPPSPLFPALLLQAFAVLFTSLLFSAGFAIYLSRPIRYLRQTSRRLAEGHLDARVTPLLAKRNDEMAELGQDFDFMATRLQTLLNAQRQLLHDVSHELRSPVARMRLAVGLAQQQPEKLQAALSRIERETERLDELLGQILTLSRLQTDMSQEVKETISLNELIEDILQDVNFEAQAVGSKVIFKSNAEASIEGHYELLHRALENVIRNAVKYSPEGESVEISLDKNDHNLITIQVHDHGPGIPESELEAVFEPFYRVTRQHKAEVTGHGLGLAIAKRAIEKHKGNVFLSNAPQGGLVVKISLYE